MSPLFLQFWTACFIIPCGHLQSTDLHGAGLNGRHGTSSLPQPEKLTLGIIYFDTLTYDNQFNCAEELLQLEKDQIHGLCLVAGTSPISQLRQQHSRLAFSVNTPSLLLVRFWFNSERSHYLKKYLCKFSADSRGTQSYLSHLLVYKMLLL